MMNAIEGAVPTPQVQIVVHSRAGRQIFRDCPPLTSRTQNIHEPVDDFPHVHMAPIATTFSLRDQRPHMRPFLVGQIAGITQQASVVTPAILVRPHRRPPESGRSLESQTVPMNQIVLGRALRNLAISRKSDHKGDNELIKRDAALAKKKYIRPLELRLNA